MLPDLPAALWGVGRVSAHHSWPGIPGLGSATAFTIYPEIGVMGRFTDSDQLVALVEVDPKLHKLGETAGQTKDEQTRLAFSEMDDLAHDPEDFASCPNVSRYLWPAAQAW
jgi:hypothetical protein